MNPAEAAPATGAGPYFNANEHPESPRPPHEGWRGLLIVGPPQAKVSIKQPLVLVRGTYRIGGDRYPKDDRLRLIAVDVATKREFAAGAGQRDPSPDVPPPPSAPPDPATLKRMVFSGYFNTDILATLKLPWKPATYRVRAMMGELASNEITVQVTFE